MPKTAIVTGGSGGMGREIVLRLTADGFAVVVGYKGSENKAKEVVAKVKSNGGSAIAIQADVSSEEDVIDLFAKSLVAFGSIDVVVHTAGIVSYSPIAKGDAKDFDKIIATNLRGTFLVLSQAAQHVTDGGRIIAFSSSVNAKAPPDYGAYIAAKEGVEGLVHVLANELRGRKICVNAVAPGPDNTPLMTDGKTKERLDELAKMAPLERIGEPVDIARVVSFLSGPDGAWMNAQVVRPNGGFA